MSSCSYDFSVLVITYNHEKFIEQCITSILSQKFGGKLQIVIGVDKSSDSTLQICKRFEAENLHIIKVIEHERNVGMFGNFHSTLKECEGKYIAILEGDDYWVSDNKLQMQYEFFELNPNCKLSAGQAYLVDENSNFLEGPKLSSKPKGDIFLRQDFIVINRFATLTTAFRKDAVIWSEIEKLRFSPHLDWGIYISLDYGRDGFAYRFNELFGAYRQHSGGVYSAATEEKKVLNVLRTIYWISQLNLEHDHKAYLKALYNSYSVKLKNKKFELEDPYNKFIDERSSIYNDHKSYKFSFIKKLYSSLWFFLLNQQAGLLQFKFNLELIRQTRYSLRPLLNLFILPILPFFFIIRIKENIIKEKVIRK